MYFDLIDVLLEFNYKGDQDSLARDLMQAATGNCPDTLSRLLPAWQAVPSEEWNRPIRALPAAGPAGRERPHRTAGSPTCARCRRSAFNHRGPATKLGAHRRRRLGSDASVLAGRLRPDPDQAEMALRATA